MSTRDAGKNEVWTLLLNGSKVLSQNSIIKLSTTGDKDEFIYDHPSNCLLCKTLLYFILFLVKNLMNIAQIRLSLREEQVRLCLFMKNRFGYVSSWRTGSVMSLHEEQVRLCLFVKNRFGYISSWRIGSVMSLHEKQVHLCLFVKNRFSCVSFVKNRFSYVSSWRTGSVVSLREE